MSNLITQETKAAHRATWWVYTGGPGRERIRRTATMRGRWPGYDVTCSCGWESRTGGATRHSVANDLWDHRYSAQVERDRQAEDTEPEMPLCTDEPEPTFAEGGRGYVIETPPAVVAERERQANCRHGYPNSEGCTDCAEQQAAFDAYRSSVVEAPPFPTYDQPCICEHTLDVSGRFPVWRIAMVPECVKHGFHLTNGLAADLRYGD